MVNLTRKESEILLKLFKDFTREYNANSLSKEINITPRGALKILKNLEEKKLAIGKEIGKAIFYKVNLNDLYTRKTIETLLVGEARENAQRWLDEFKDVFSSTEIVLIFGSIIKNSKHASDIDILFIMEKQNYKKVNGFIKEKNKIMHKKIHSIPQTIQDLKENLKNRNPAIVDSIRTGYVLHGFDKIVEVIKNVAGT